MSKTPHQGYPKISKKSQNSSVSCARYNLRSSFVSSVSIVYKNHWALQKKRRYFAVSPAKQTKDFWVKFPVEMDGTSKKGMYLSLLEMLRSSQLLFSMPFRHSSKSFSSRCSYTWYLQAYMANWEPLWLVPHRSGPRQGLSNFMKSWDDFIMAGQSNHPPPPSGNKGLIRPC